MSSLARRAYPLAALLCLSCIPDLPERPEPYETYLLQADPSFSSGERLQLEWACVEWFGVTSGKLYCKVTSEPGDAFVRRGRTRDGYLFQLDASRRELVLDAEGFTREGYTLSDMQAAMENMIGRAAGMKQHDGVGVLSKKDVTPGITEDDVRMCREAGFCP